MELRPYQSQMLTAIVQAWKEHARVLGCLPTGGGKTEVAIELIRNEATFEHRVLVIVDRKNLCKQWVDRLARHGVHDVGILQADNTKRVYAPVLVATAQTIRSYAKKRGMPENIGLIIIDESHIWHQTHDDVLAQMDGARVLGLSATPLREGLALRFDTMVVGATIRELMEAGHLVRPRYLAPRQDAIEEALASVQVRAGDYASNQLSKAMRTKRIIGDVVATWAKHAIDRLTICFCVDKVHAHDLAAEFNAAGHAAEAITDETPDEERADMFKRFEAGTTRVLCSVGVLAVGFDSPIASCAILARPTLSLSLYVQQGGRVLRPHPTKADALVLDHAGNTLRHGLLEEFVPPADLSEVVKGADKKSKKDKPLAWVCRGCEAVNDLADDICTECGLPRRRQTTVMVLDGELVPVSHEANETPAGLTHEELRRGYLMFMHYAESKNLKPGWAFYATARRFRIDPAKAREVIPFGWRDLPPIPPDAEANRWLRADWQRQRIAARYSSRPTSHAQPRPY